jgi:hypothetical protein
MSTILICLEGNLFQSTLGKLLRSQQCGVESFPPQAMLSNWPTHVLQSGHGLFSRCCDTGTLHQPPLVTERLDLTELSAPGVPPYPDTLQTH